MTVPRWAWFAGLVVLLVGAYCFGRRDAPNKSDNVTESLLQGIKGYRDENAALRKELAAAQQEVDAGLAREKKLAAKRTVTPAIVPASCAPWAENLSTCDQQVTALRSSLEATGRLKALAEQGRARDAGRVDSLTKALAREHGRDRILGIKLPSRTTSLGAGAVLGAIAHALITR